MQRGARRQLKVADRSCKSSNQTLSLHAPSLIKQVTKHVIHPWPPAIAVDVSSSHKRDTAATGRRTLAEQPLYFYLTKRSRLLQPIPSGFNTPHTLLATRAHTSERTHYVFTDSIPSFTAMFHRHVLDISPPGRACLSPSKSFWKPMTDHMIVLPSSRSRR